MSARNDITIASRYRHYAEYGNRLITLDSEICQYMRMTFSTLFVAYQHGRSDSLLASRYLYKVETTNNP